jgi:hypothetical protein
LEYSHYRYADGTDDAPAHRANTDFGVFFSTNQRLDFFDQLISPVLTHTVMFTQLQIINLLKNELPVVAGADCAEVSAHTFNSIHSSIHYLSACTKNTMEQRHFPAARSCFGLAEKVYREGDAMVKLLIENVFVYANVWTKTRNTPSSWSADIVPDVLYKIHLKQLNDSGC